MLRRRYMAISRDVFTLMSQIIAQNLNPIKNRSVQKMFYAFFLRLCVTFRLSAYQIEHTNKIYNNRQFNQVAVIYHLKFNEINDNIECLVFAFCY